MAGRIVAVILGGRINNVPVRVISAGDFAPGKSTEGEGVLRARAQVDGDDAATGTVATRVDRMQIGNAVLGGAKADRHDSRSRAGVELGPAAADNFSAVQNLGLMDMAIQ